MTHGSGGMAPPRVSVIVPLFNKAMTICRAMESVRRQTETEYEVIVVDDGSTDGGGDHVRSMGDARIRVLTQGNRGVSAARNEGARAARSALLAFLDADDEWEPDYLETIFRLQSRWPDAGVFATSYRFCGTRTRSAVLRGGAGVGDMGLLHDYFQVALVSDPPLWTSAVAVRREAWAEVGGFPENVISGEDLLTWARMAARYPIAYCAIPKARFWEPEGPQSRPGRVPREPDVVGTELMNLYRQRGREGRCRGLDRYIAHWHRMRAHIYLQLGNPGGARLELRRSVQFALGPKTVALYLIALAPTMWTRRLIGMARAARRALRHRSGSSSRPRVGA